MLLLIFLALDGIQLCYRFTCSLADKPAVYWPPAVRKRLNRYPPCSEGCEEQIVGECAERRVCKETRCRNELADEILKVQAIAECSEPVRRTVFHPLVVLLMILLARLPFVGSAGMPWPVAVLGGTLFVLIVIGAIALRVSGTKAREGILARLQDGLARTTTSATLCEDREKCIQGYKQVIQEVKEERRGVFLPITQDLIFQFVALPFGGVGGLMLLQELLNSF